MYNIFLRLIYKEKKIGKRLCWILFFNKVAGSPVAVNADEPPVNNYLTNPKPVESAIRSDSRKKNTK